MQQTTSDRQKTVITAEQYRALQRPIELPTPQHLFNFEVETLEAKGLMAYDTADAFRKDLPSGLFLLVPAQPVELDLNHLMGLVEIDGKTGVNYLDVQYIKDVVDISRAAHMMLDIEDGAERLNVKPSISRANIKAEGRLPYNIWRGIVHVVVFPQVLGHHYMDLVGSRCGEGDVPFLCLVGRPGLGRRWEGSALPEWGAPSCGSVGVP